VQQQLVKQAGLAHQVLPLVSVVVSPVEVAAFQA
jgi:hypothetical protein